MLIRRAAKSDYPKLILILALAFYLTFIPHLDYPYPVHLDDWSSLAYFKSLLNAGSVTFPDPFTGEAARYPGLEVGFQIFWSTFQRVSGIDWLIVFRYFPSVIFMVTVLSVYVLARREGFGLEAAFFASLLPTTVGILGPAFLVPVAMGLLFIPLTLFVALNFRTWASYLVLLLFLLLLLILHPPTAVGLLIILLPLILIGFRMDLKHSLKTVSTLLVPLAVLFVIIPPWVFDFIMPAAETLLKPSFPSEYVDYPQLTTAYGYLPLSFTLLGCFVLIMKGGYKNFSLVLGLLTLLLMLVSFRVFHYGLAIFYERGMTLTMLMAGIIAGAGLMSIRNFLSSPRANASLLERAIASGKYKFVCWLFVVVILIIAIPQRLNTPYYHMIDKEDYATFVWIKNNIGSEYDKALLDPWKATAFTAITEKYVYARNTVRPNWMDELAIEHLDKGCNDTKFLRDNGISIVYTEKDCTNPDLVKIRENVYLLETSEASQK